MADMKFPSPHEAPTIPGTEGWERMYPYHYMYSTEDPERNSGAPDALAQLGTLAWPGMGW